ncbi:hypothetical protein FKP32DRAFT_1586417 [Trametes sanguinea]|nr:hypothetical protein FKP32DRAFT_1590833 [Trametes sanguinea]KAI9065663.1 hypothetical protein FKP32DRAFT_1590446 [Trametes sanguinea]KAI9067827.1 hypothetical protein FKP32DRAFT_1588183 [Trametes sanguinea]KAI9067881.1 hypothetical protein FKP32DRAFT_1588242 [Trametes sanguinea]KAI9070083.1 hypothetical protein FKP32DRAFT_1586417 [Trametes sanguinea]
MPPVLLLSSMQEHQSGPPHHRLPLLRAAYTSPFVSSALPAQDQWQGHPLGPPGLTSY